MTSLISARCAASVFSLTPPIGRTLPVRVTSPVIATWGLMGLLRASDSSAVIMVQPALGPSFGVAPVVKSGMLIMRLTMVLMPVMLSIIVTIV